MQCNYVKTEVKPAKSNDKTSFILTKCCPRHRFEKFSSCTPNTSNFLVWDHSDNANPDNKYHNRRLQAGCTRNYFQINALRWIKHRYRLLCRRPFSFRRGVELRLIYRFLSCCSCGVGCSGKVHWWSGVASDVSIFIFNSGNTTWSIWWLSGCYLTRCSSVYWLH